MYVACHLKQMKPPPWSAEAPAIPGDIATVLRESGLGGVVSFATGVGVAACAAADAAVSDMAIASKRTMLRIAASEMLVITQYGFRQATRTRV